MRLHAIAVTRRHGSACGKIALHDYRGTVRFGDNDRDLDGTTTVEIKDIGTTKIEIPDAANKKLS